MHSSLEPRSKMIMIGACLLVAFGTAMAGHVIPVTAWAFAVVFGVAAGGLQARSIGLAPEGFKRAQTSVEVRTALMSNRSGQLTVLLQWGVVPVLLLAAYFGGNLIAGALGGYALFMAVRDLVALRAVMSLTSA